ncbi:PREDICTED: uncharacterized protein LOC109580167 [Amphimedon queenslandica]|uniref:Sushi domain-containing protein n=1 Tax=Amphimedon queenslandica TaxID=400682 RepID=A0AAN0IVP8_AMPQE|nr:PREDICTED: uncharacterized protein LOC109580167 [Amphimedon queenslandica]|eukprot:XP_019848637.1 PREDICTED: uncharacterized protein LOC109580167 [Amphimedon queenslandica]
MYSFSKVMGAVALFLCLLSVADSQLQFFDWGTGELVTGGIYKINQGYNLSLVCFYNGKPGGPTITWFRNQIQVLDNMNFIASSITNTSKLSEGVSIEDFRQLFQSSNSISSLMSSYVNGSDIILPDSSIGGHYTCEDGDNLLNLTIVVSSPSGSFSEFYVRMTGLIFSASSVNNKDYDLAVFESRLFTNAVIAGLNASDDPIRTISCSFVPLTAQHFGNQSLDRIECNVREYPPNKQLMLNVAQNIYETINLLVSEDFQELQISEFGFCNESYTTSSVYGNNTWPEIALTSRRTSSSVSRSCNFGCGFVTRICRVTGWDTPDYSRCGVSAETVSIFDINGAFVRDFYTINQGYFFLLFCGIFCKTGEEFKWFDSNGNEVQKLTEFINSSFTLVNDGIRLLNEELSISDFKGLYSQQFIGRTYLISYIDLRRESELILPGISISGSYTCRSSSGNYSQTVSVSTKNPSGPFTQFFFRFTAFFINISLTDVEDKDYKLEVLEANIFNEAVVDSFNATINPIRKIYCHFVPLMEEDVTGDRVECDVREYPPNSSFVAIVWQNISTFISDTDNNAFQSIVMSVTGFCSQSQTESLDFGVHTWSESVGNTILALPCGNHPMINVTRMCQTNGVGWENPDYSQCETNTCENDTIVTNRGTFQWPVTPVESLAFLTCPHGPIGARAIRQCRRNGAWDTHDISNCADPRITAEFASIADTNVTLENVVQIVQNLSNIVMLASQPGDQNENNLRNVSSLLIQTANLFSSPNVIIMLSTEDVSMV